MSEYSDVVKARFDRLEEIAKELGRSSIPVDERAESDNDESYKDLTKQSLRLV